MDRSARFVCIFYTGECRGQRQEVGPKGDSIVGPAGRDGKDADIGLVIAAATKAARELVQKEAADLALRMKEMITDLLIERGVLDHNGKAILLPGPTGPTGPTGRPGNIDAAVIQAEKAALALVSAEIATLRKELALTGDPSPSSTQALVRA